MLEPTCAWAEGTAGLGPGHGFLAQRSPFLFWPEHSEWEEHLGCPQPASATDSGIPPFLTLPFGTQKLLVALSWGSLGLQLPFGTRSVLHGPKDAL